MRRVIVIAVAALVLGGCCPCRRLAESSSRSDSVMVVVRDSFIVRADTVSVELPVERLVNVTTDTVSRLETSCAVSVAEVSGGVLRHSLENTGPARAIVRTEYRTSDTVIYRDRTAEEVRVVKVNELNGWQRFRCDAFLPLLVLLAVTVAAHFRRSL